VSNDRRIDYIEFPATEITATKQFYSTAFGWMFEDFGPKYTSFNDGRLAGGFWENGMESVGGGALVVLYASNLEETEQRVRQAGGAISKDIFTFPGGRRFHFKDPSGNELAVWSE